MQMQEPHRISLLIKNTLIYPASYNMSDNPSVHAYANTCASMSIQRSKDPDPKILSGETHRQGVEMANPLQL